MSRRGSIRRPLMVYALVTSVTCGAAIATVASLTIAGLVRADRDAVLEELAEHMAAGTVGPRVRSVYLAVSDSAAEGSGAVAIRSSTTGTLYATPRGPLTAPPVGRAIRRLMVLALGIAIASGLVSGWITARLVLAPLHDLARTTERDGVPVELRSDATVDEVHTVARAFRETIRTIRDERAMLEQQAAELGSLQTQVARADRLASIGHLAAGVAHEIGNPLAAVMGYLHLIQRGLPADEQAEVVDRSAKELQRIHGTIRKLLEFTRSEPGADTKPRAILLSSTIRETQTLVRAHPALRSVEVTVDLPADPELYVFADERGLGQVLVNLLVNAGQAMAAQTDGRVHLFVQDSGALVEVVVDDSGPGIPPDQRTEVFEPFFTTKPSGEGTGLGLSVCRSLMDQMGGHIDIADAPTGGARFVVRMRRATKSVT